MDLNQMRSLTTALKMSKDDKNELATRLMKSKSVEESRKIKREFFKEKGYRFPTMLDRWEADSELYKSKK